MVPLPDHGLHLPNPPTMDDAISEPNGAPVIMQPRIGSHHRQQIRRIRDGPRDDALNAALGQAGEAVQRRLQVVLDSVQVGREELLAESRRNTVPGSRGVPGSGGRSQELIFLMHKL
jgi:hypothetical protein